MVSYYLFRDANKQAEARVESQARRWERRCNKWFLIDSFFATNISLSKKLSDMNNFILRNQVFVYFFLQSFTSSPFQRWLQKESRWNQGESEENIYRYDILHFSLFYIATFFALPSYNYHKLSFTGLIICVCICASLSVSLSVSLSLHLSHFYLSLLSLSLFPSIRWYGWRHCEWRNIPSDQHEEF